MEFLDRKLLSWAPYLIAACRYMAGHGLYGVLYRVQVRPLFFFFFFLSQFNRTREHCSHSRAVLPLRCRRALHRHPAPARVSCSLCVSLAPSPGVYA